MKCPDCDLHRQSQGPLMDLQQPSLMTWQRLSAYKIQLRGMETQARQEH